MPEQILLGAMLANGAVREAGLRLCGMDDFSDAFHARIFQTIGDLHDAGHAVTHRGVRARMLNDPAWSELPCEYLESLIDAGRGETEARPLINAMLRQQKLAPPEMVDRDLPLILASDFDGQEVPTREEFVEGLIPKRNVTLLYGDGGVGKSLLALQLAVTVRLRTNWLGRVVTENGPVLLLSAEDDIPELHKRLHEILAHEGASFRQLDHFHIAPLVGEDALLATITQGNALEPTGLFRSTERAIDKIRPSLIIPDNLSDVFGGNEINRLHARQFIGMMRGWAVKYDTTILLPAHPSLSGMSSGSGTSGSTGWNASVRARLYLERVKNTDNSEDDADIRVLTTKKVNYGLAGGQIKLRWQRGVFVVEGSGERFATIASHAKADKVFLDMLETYTIEDRNVGIAQGHSYAPAAFAKDKRCSVGKLMLKDAMDRLFQQGRIRLETTGPASRQTKRLVIAKGGPQ